MTEKSTPEVSIRLRSYDIDTMGAHHNAVAFYIDGREEFTIHGLAMDHKTGDVVPVGDRKDTLRALTLPEGFNKIFDLPVNGEHVIFEGSLKESAPKIVAALDAVHFINAQNLNYDAYELIGEAQNSNSVAHTIVTAMGEKFPEESERYWAPGHDRILLPKDWSSLYMDPGIPENFLRDALQPENLQKVHVETVIKHAMSDPIPDRKNIFFDRDKPFVPYAPFAHEKPEIADTAPTPPSSAPATPSAPKV